jgi:TraY domain-containing protein
MARKRAPGGGRKPQGEFSNKRALLATRVTLETRKSLDAAARKSGRSLSQEVEYRLRDSLKISDKVRRQPASAALAYLATRLAETISVISKRPWHSNRWCIETLKFAVTKLLDQVPAREDDQPAHLNNLTPELFGTALGLQVFYSVERADPDDNAAATWPEEFRPDFEIAVHALSNVRRDLNIPFKPRKKDPQQ